MFKIFSALFQKEFYVVSSEEENFDIASSAIAGLNGGTRDVLFIGSQWVVPIYVVLCLKANIL